MALDDTDDQRRLEVLAAELAGSRQQLSYLDHDLVTRESEILAARLRAAIGAERLPDWYFMPIPRGGLIVLGLVSYFLELTPKQLPPHPPGERPIVFVDDASYSGLRILEYAQHFASSTTAAGFIATHPTLRERLVGDGLEFCVSAIDLTELRSDRTANEQSTSGLSSARRAWEGATTGVAFPWTEPEHNIRTGDTLERGWRLVSPTQCLRNRSELAPPLDRRGEARLAFPERIAYGDFETHMLVCLLDRGEVFRLDRVAATMWSALGVYGEVEPATGHVTQLFDADREIVRADMVEVAGNFVDAGLLIEHTR